MKRLSLFLTLLLTVSSSINVGAQSIGTDTTKKVIKNYDLPYIAKHKEAKYDLSDKYNNDYTYTPTQKYSQSRSAETQNQVVIIMTTAKMPGSEIRLGLISYAPFSVDWGNGEKKNYNAGYYDYKPISGKTDGTIIIYGDPTKITMLNCFGNQLIALDVSQNIGLTDLYCQDNDLMSLDVTKNTSLQTLTFGSTSLTEIDLTKNTELKVLRCSGNQLTNLDISKNYKLEELSYSGIRLKSIDVSKNTALKKLYCSSSGLTTLDVSKNTILETLICRQNKLTNLDLSNNILLSYLDCSYNQLTTLDVSKNIALETISCHYNQLTSLDVSDNTVLKSLSCDKNQLSSLNIDKNIELKYLYCNYNKIRNLDLKNNIALELLGCEDNQLIQLDLTNNVNLRILGFPENKLSKIDVSKNLKLTGLWCSANQIVTLDVTKNTALSELNCSANQLSVLDVNNNKALINLYINHNQLSISSLYNIYNQLSEVHHVERQVLSGFVYVNQRDLFISGNPGAAASSTSIATAKGWFPDVEGNPSNFHTVTVTAQPASGGVVTGTNTSSGTYLNGERATFTAIPNDGYAFVNWTDDGKEISTSENFDYIVWEDKTFNANFRQANLSVQDTVIIMTTISDRLFLRIVSEADFAIDVGNGIKRIYAAGVPEQFSEIKTVGSNVVIYGDASKITAFECISSKLTTLDVSRATALEQVSCYGGNNLVALDFSKNTALKELNCTGNQLSHLDLSKNIALINLRCSGNLLTNLDVSNNLMLKDLQCTNNQLKVLNISKNTKLTNLSCNFNQLSNLDVSNNTNLSVLNCGKNQLTILDVTKNTFLRTLDCSNNQLFTLNLNQKLNYLYCNNNQLTHLDVKNKGWLREIHCNNNQLSSLDIDSYTGTALNRLECSDNKITEINLGSSYVLFGLNVKNNLLSATSLNNIYNQLPNVSAFQVDDWHKDWQKRLFVSGNPGVVASNTSIAVQKGWIYNYAIVNFTPSSTGIIKVFDGAKEILPGEAVELETTLRIEAIPNYGYKLTSVQANEKALAWDNTIKVTSETTIKAVFEKETYTIEIMSIPTIGGAITGYGDFPYETNCELSATPRKGFSFEKWTNKKGETVSTDAIYSFSITQSDTLTAHFALAPIVIVMQPTDITPSGTVITYPTGYSYSIDGKNWQSSNVFINLPIGSYNIQVKDNKGNITQPILVVISPTGIITTQNYQIKVTHIGCPDVNDGIIDISFAKSNNYTVNVKGSNYDMTLKISGASHSISGLPPGKYELVFTIDGLANYCQKFEVIITQQVQRLSVSKLALANNQATYSLKGGTRFTVTHNGQTRETSEDEVQIPLIRGRNFIRITAESECQGVFEDVVYSNGSDGLMLFPNPTTGYFSVVIPDKEEEVIVEVKSISDYSILKERKKVSLNGLIDMDISAYPSGIYLVKVNGKTVQIVNKVIKK